MRKIFAIFLILVINTQLAFAGKPIIDKTKGYVGDLPELGKQFQKEEPSSTKPQYEATKHFNSENEVKPIPRDNPAFVNIILKPLVMRARPYQTHSQIKEWWTLVNAHTEKDYSFPSGHVSSFASTVIGICFGFKNKKWLFLGVPLALLMCVSRNYLMVHYPTDVLASLITSSIAVAIGVLITNKAFNKIEEKENKFSKFVLTASIVNLFKKKEKTKD